MKRPEGGAYRGRWFDILAFGLVLIRGREGAYLFSRGLGAY